MNTANKTAPLYSEESYGSYGAFEIKIEVGATKLPDLNCEAIRTVTYEAVRKIKSAVMEEIIKNNPEAMKRAADDKAAILALFPGQPFVEEIPNGYCPDYCCKHLPWFIVTTQVGLIKIGWRKRVIEIDWSETHRTKSSHELFASEDVTKGEREIHAWSYEKARDYIEAIIRSDPAATYGI